VQAAVSTAEPSGHDDAVGLLASLTTQLCIEQTAMNLTVILKALLPNLMAIVQSQSSGNT